MADHYTTDIRGNQRFERERERERVEKRRNITFR